MITVAFDVDETLITFPSDQPNYKAIRLFHALEELGCQMYIWSGGGLEYAKRWAEKLGLAATIVEKGSFKPDLAIDDMEVTLGKVNLQIKPAVNQEIMTLPEKL